MGKYLKIDNKNQMLDLLANTRSREKEVGSNFREAATFSSGADETGN